MWQIRKPKDQVSPEEVAERTEEDRRLMTTGDAGAFATTSCIPTSRSSFTSGCSA